MNISVVIPAYNAKNTLSTVIESVIAELLDEDQIIVADDRSDDSTAEIARGIDRVEYTVSSRSPGAAGTRNSGAALARNQWILFIDSDAVPPIGWREVLEESMLENVQGIQAVYGKNAPGTGASTYYKNYYYYYTFTKRITSKSVSGCATYFFAVQKKVFFELGGFDENFAGASVEDAEFAARLTGAGGTILLVPRLQVLHLKEYSFREFLRYEWMLMTARARLLVRRKEGAGRVSSVSMAKPAEMLVVLLSAIIVWLIPAGALLWILGYPMGLAVAGGAFLFVFISHGLFWTAMLKDGGSRGLKAVLITFPDLMLLLPAVLFSLFRSVLKPSEI